MRNGVPQDFRSRSAPLDHVALDRRTLKTEYVGGISIGVVWGVILGAGGMLVLQWWIGAGSVACASLQ